MPSIQVISSRNKFKKEFKAWFKKKYNIFSSVTIKDGLKNLQKMDIDLLLVDILPVHQETDSWLRSILRQKNPAEGEIALVFILDPENVSQAWLKSLNKITHHYHLFWSPQVFQQSSDIYFTSLESTLIGSMEKLNSIRSASRYRQKLESADHFLKDMFLIPKKTNIEFSHPVSFLPETNSNLQFLEKVHTALKKSRFVYLSAAEGLEAESIARYIHLVSSPGNKFHFSDLSEISPALHQSLFFGESQKNLPGFRYLEGGLLETSRKETVIIKNIQELKWETQNNVLIALKNQFFYREDQKIPVKCKIIFLAGNLEKHVEKGGFRQDLFSLISNFSIKVPGIQERSEDLSLVIDFYAKWYKNRFHKSINIPPNLKKRIMDKKYPGQFEEFFSFLKKVFSFSSGELTEDTLDILEGKYKMPLPRTSNRRINKFEREYLIKDPSQFLFSPDTQPVNIEYSLVDLEREYIKYILLKNSFNIAESSRILGISRKTLYDKLKKFKIQVSQKSAG